MNFKIIRHIYTLLRLEIKLTQNRFKVTKFLNNNRK